MTLKDKSINILLVMIALLFIMNLGENYFIYNKTLKHTETNSITIEKLNNTIKNQEDNIITINRNIEILQKTIDNLVTNDAASNYLLDNLENNVEYIDDRLDTLEHELHIIEKNNSQNLEKISDLEDHIEDLYREIGVQSGDKLYLDNRIWYEYNASLDLETIGVTSKDPSIVEGVATIGDNESFTRTIFTWQYDAYGYYSSNIDIINNEMETILEENGFSNVEKIDSETINYNSHKIAVNTYSINVQETQYYCKIAYWFCQPQKRVYSFMVFTDELSSLETLFTNNLQNFKCHR